MPYALTERKKESAGLEEQRSRLERTEAVRVGSRPSWAEVRRLGLGSEGQGQREEGPEVQGQTRGHRRRRQSSTARREEYGRRAEGRHCGVCNEGRRLVVLGDNQICTKCEVYKEIGTDEWTAGRDLQELRDLNSLELLSFFEEEIGRLSSEVVRQGELIGTLAAALVAARERVPDVHLQDQHDGPRGEVVDVQEVPGERADARDHPGGHEQEGKSGC